MAKKEATPADAGAPSGGKSKLKLILLIVVGLLLAIGLSVGGTWFFLSKSLKAEKTEEVASEAAKPGKQP
ncbi:TPA: flagellar basal body-associated protein FliL, partial [Pseudomonas aeruginosa]|nr:flagellar basal body-associated protein FliL [Pseudomonas aeruginosa]